MHSSRFSLSVGCKENQEESKSEWNCELAMRHPFGSFRHYGSFPTSLINGSTTSRHLRAPSIDFQTYASSNQATDSLYECSTHLYINMIDHSDFVMSRQIWKESDEEIDMEVDNASEFSSIHSENDESDLFLPDYRGGDEYWHNTEQFEHILFSRDIVGGPVKISVGDQNRNDDKPPTTSGKLLPNTSPFRKSTLSKAKLDLNVATWLEQINLQNRKRNLTQLSTLSNIQASAIHSPSTNQFQLLSTSSDLTSCDSSVAKTDNNRVACDTSRQDEETSTFIRNQVSVNSDSISFMHRPLISCGVTDTKSVPSKGQQLFKRLRKLRKLFSKNSRAKVQKHS